MDITIKNPVGREIKFTCEVVENDVCVFEANQGMDKKYLLVLPAYDLNNPNAQEYIKGRILQKKLANKIFGFLRHFGNKDVNDDSEWNSPDASWLEGVAQLLAQGITEWHWFGSSYMHGGYKHSKECEAMHEEILEELKLIHNK